MYIHRYIYVFVYTHIFVYTYTYIHIEAHAYVNTPATCDTHMIRRTRAAASSLTWKKRCKKPLKLFAV